MYQSNVQYLHITVYIPVVGHNLHCLPKLNATPERMLQHSEKLVVAVPIGVPVQRVLR